MKIFLICLAIFVFINLLVFVFLSPFIVYRIILVRTKPSKWSRKCSNLKDREHVSMFEQGIKWNEDYKDCVEEVRIESAGFKLAAQYFDFGKRRAAIIISGRSESSLYCCYFAEAYRKMGYNLLLIDNRAHGLSEGKYDNTGFTEYVDILAWSKFLHDIKNNESVICHGICIGAATALYAMVDENCPDYVQGLVADGMFTTFRESFDNHLKEFHQLQFPTTLMVMSFIKKHSGVDAYHYGPISVIQKLKKPILFLHGKEDKFSLPENALELYEKCCGPKEIVWFEKGKHSHLRINAPEKYDDSICGFIKKYFG